MGKLPENKPKGGTKVDATSLNELNRYTINWLDRPKKLEKGWYTFHHDNLEYDFLYNPGDEKRLFVLLSGYANRQKFEPPVFQRWSWSKQFPGHCLCISDPALKLSEDVGLAWYIGTEDKEVLPTISEIIRYVADNLDISMKNVVLYASSGGGFAALHLSLLMEDITTVVINPQTDITRYNNGTVDRFLKRYYSGISRKDAIDRYQNRMSIIPSCDKLKHNKILYAQNIMDVHHYEEHFKPFAEAVGLSKENNYKVNNVEAILFEHPGGHTKAETKEIFQILITKAIQMGEV